MIFFFLTFFFKKFEEKADGFFFPLYVQDRSRLRHGRLSHVDVDSVRLGLHEHPGADSVVVFDARRALISYSFNLGAVFL